MRFYKAAYDHLSIVTENDIQAMVESLSHKDPSITFDQCLKIGHYEPCTVQDIIRAYCECEGDCGEVNAAMCMAAGATDEKIAFRKLVDPRLIEVAEAVDEYMYYSAPLKVLLRLFDLLENNEHITISDLYVSDPEAIFDTLY